MGKLKPIGSEKLQGMDKITRIMEIARYNEHIPQPINEDKSIEYGIVLADGKKYQIVKEKVGYVIKRSLTESVNEFEYLEPMKNRKHYSSYSEAFKRLNIIAKEVNTLTGYEKNISLFTESDVDVKKYVLKMKEQAPAPEQMAPTSPAPAPAPTEEPVMSPKETPAPVEEPMEPEMDMEVETEPEEEVVTFKTIQKLTGKLGQKIREFLSNEENQMTSKDIKYVVNSVLSALDLNKLEAEDKEEIMGKFEGGEEMAPSEEPEMEPEMETEPVAEPTGEEMVEMMDPEDDEMDIDDIFSEGGETDEQWQALAADMAVAAAPAVATWALDKAFGGEMDEEVPSYPKHQPRHRKIHHKDITDEESYAMEEMIEGMFTESKVDNILKKYFKIDEKEKFLMEEKKKRLTEETKRKEKIRNKITNLSESIAQEVSSRKLFSKYPTAKFIGKSEQNNLIFEINNKRIRVTPKGSVK